MGRGGNALTPRLGTCVCVCSLELCVRCVWLCVCVCLCARAPGHDVGQGAVSYPVALDGNGTAYVGTRAGFLLVLAPGTSARALRGCSLGARLAVPGRSRDGDCCGLGAPWHAASPGGGWRAPPPWAHAVCALGPGARPRAAPVAPCFPTARSECRLRTIVLGCVPAVGPSCRWRAAADCHTSSKGHGPIAPWIYGVAAGGGVLVVVAAVVWCRRSKREERKPVVRDFECRTLRGTSLCPFAQTARVVSEAQRLLGHCAGLPLAAVGRPSPLCGAPHFVAPPPPPHRAACVRSPPTTTTRHGHPPSLAR
jgi:hypothetical protein